MLDFDLAQMYGTETAQLKRTIRRNKKRFDGEDFMFEVTRDELSKCQIGTLNKGRGSNIKYLPFAFTELGVAILSSVLNSETAIEINKGIMRAFVAIRQLITNPPSCRNEELQQEMKKLRNYMEEIFADQTISTKTPAYNPNSSIRHWQNCRYIKNCQTNRAALSVLSARKKINRVFNTI